MREYYRIVLILSVVSAIRVVLDWSLMYHFSLSAQALLGSLHMFLYIYVLFLGIPGLAFIILKTALKTEVSYPQRRAVFVASYKIWYCYPVVPIVTWMTGDSYAAEIEFLSSIPTFMNQNNYFPSGMILVIPFILGYFTTILRQHFQLSWITAFLTTFFSAVIVYLVFYQYALAVAYELWDRFDFYMFMSFYLCITIVFKQLFVNQFNASFGESNFWSNVIYGFFFLVGIALFIVSIVDRGALNLNWFSNG